MTGPSSISGFVASGNFCNTNNKYTLYFVAEFDHLFTLQETSKRSYLLSCAQGDSDQVHMRVGISFVSVANAAQNLRTENSGYDFDSVRTAAQTTWDQYLWQNCCPNW
ncbi:MAG: glycoside hydrolase family 92 protein [Deltaproteobacteria bacterium]|nr:glycoside hydrolase family 92 protein [Deltaproteobacteria bacterium]